LNVIHPPFQGQNLNELTKSEIKHIQNGYYVSTNKDFEVVIFWDFIGKDKDVLLQTEPIQMVLDEKCKGAEANQIDC
jgi:hypothetical protein